MMTGATTKDSGHARYTFRVRLSNTARRALEAEWDRCRWLWNECVAKSKQVHVQSKAGGGKLTCGPARLDKMLTEARRVTPWLAEGASVPQQQVIRDFARSRAKALKDIKDRLPMHRRAGMPRWKRKRDARPSLNYTKRGWLELLRMQRATAPHDGGVIVIDDSGDRKDGRATAHVGRQWLGRYGKTDNGIGTVTTVWTDGRVYYPLHAQPDTPAHHFARGRSDPAFRTKPQLAAGFAARAKAAGFAAGRWSPTAPTASATTGTSRCVTPDRPTWWCSNRATMPGPRPTSRTPPSMPRTP
jgi:hypothetical protein